jgi:serine-type D-Ala-D-Ala carboxypeptidase (penicillin-binding protein 5/6)
MFALFVCAAASLAVALGARAAAADDARPEIAAPSAVLVDARDGHVLFRRSARARRAVASATKLMTALLSLEELRLRRRLAAAPYRAGPAESRINLRPGERMSVGDLLRALLLESANDAAVTLAHGVADSVDGFVERMNERAREMNLSDTRFANPIGLDQPGNFSSALDLSRLTRRLLRNDTFAAIVDLPQARLSTGSRPRTVANRNDLVRRVPWIDGVKTGHTLQAGYVLIGSGRRKGARLVSVVLGSPSEARRDSDTLALLDYGFGLYRRARAVRPGATVASADVAFYGDRRVRLIARRGLTLSVRRGQRVRTAVRAPDELEGPIRDGTPVGSVSVFRDGKRVALAPLVTAEPVPGAGTLRKIVHNLLRPGVLVTVVALVALGTVALRRRAAAKS